MPTKNLPTETMRDETVPALALPPASSIVLLHGIGGSARGWPAQETGFAAAGLRVVPLDLPGFGARPPVDALDFDGMAADTEAAIERLSLERPVLLGHSLGGMVVQSMLRRRPTAYRAAILSGTSSAFGSPDGDFQKAFVAARLRPLEEGRTMAEMAPGIIDAILGPGAAAADRDLAIQLMATTSPRTYRAAVHAIVGFDERANLASIAVPVLCLAAERDANAPAAMMQRMAGRIPGASYVCLPGIGHLPNLEAPEAFNAAVMEFVRSLAATDTGR